MDQTLIRHIGLQSRTCESDQCLDETRRTLRIETRYYEADVPIWVDDIEDINNWVIQWSSDEAKEVREEVGYIVLGIRQDYPVKQAITLVEQMLLFIDNNYEQDSFCDGPSAWSKPELLVVAVEDPLDMDALAFEDTEIWQYFKSQRLGEFEWLTMKAQQDARMRKFDRVKDIYDVIQLYPWCGVENLHDDDEINLGDIQEQGTDGLHKKIENMLNLMSDIGVHNNEQIRENDVDKFAVTLEQAASLRKELSNRPLEERKQILQSIFSSFGVPVSDYIDQ